MIDDKNVNTSETLFKDSKKSDAELKMEDKKAKAKLSKTKFVKFKCEPVYAAIFPHGFDSHCQGFYFRLVFDGRTIELPEFVANFAKEKLEAKALSYVDKKNRNASKEMEFLGRFDA